MLESENISGTTNLHVSHCYLESCTEVGIIRDRDDTFFLDGSEFSFSIHEVAVSLLSLAPDSSAELMQLCETEILWINDDDRIRPEEIDPIFYDRRREEDIIVSFLEGMDTILDLFTWHLTMSDDDSGFVG